MSNIETEPIFDSIEHSLNLTSKSVKKALISECFQSFYGQKNASENGLQLLSAKTELLARYIELICLTIIARIDNCSDSEWNSLNDDLLKCRLYLEKVVNPLENKLKPWMQQMLQAATLSQSLSKKKQDLASFKDATIEENSEIQLYKPNLQDFGEDESDDEQQSNNKDKKFYRAPKIAPALPPDEYKKAKSNFQRPNAAIRDFVEEFGDEPIEEPSVGSNIRPKGRAVGLSSQKDFAEQKAIEEYEENSFRRINNISKRDKKRIRVGGSSNFQDLDGEDWSILNKYNRDFTMRNMKKSKNTRHDSIALGSTTTGANQPRTIEMFNKQRSKTFKSLKKKHPYKP